MLRNLFLKTLRDYRWSILGYGLGGALYALVVLAVYPYIQSAPGFAELVESYPPAIRNLVGLTDAKMFITLEGFLGLEMFSLIPLVFAVFTVNAAGNMVAGEEERGTIDLLLSNPIPRWRLVLEKYGAAVAAMLFICLLTAAGLIIGVIAIGEEASWGRLVAGAFNLLPISLLFGSLTLLLTAFLRRRVAVGIGMGLAIASYFWNGLAPLVESLEPYRKVSPFYLYRHTKVLVEGLRWGDVGILLGLSALLLLLSLVAFRRKDLGV